MYAVHVSVTGKYIKSGLSSLLFIVPRFTPSPYLKKMSGLLGLPIEIRRMIWVCLFAQTRLFFTKQGAKKYKNPRKSTLRTELAILATCKMIQMETEGLWMKYVFFNFCDSRRMLDKLASLPHASQSLISKLEICAPHNLQLGFPIGDIVSTAGSPSEKPSFSVWQALSLVKGLKLDTLLIDCRNQEERRRPPQELYEELDGLIRHPRGWQTLMFLTAQSTILGYGTTDPSKQRNLQPQIWHRELCLKDDVKYSHQSFVRIYRATSASMQDTTFRSCSFEKFEQDEPSTRRTTMKADPILNSKNEKDKGILVIARRGTPAKPQEEIAQTVFDKEAKTCVEIILDRGVGTMSWETIKLAETRYERIVKVRGHGRDLTIQDVRSAVYKMWDHFIDCHQIVSSGRYAPRGQNIMDGILKSHKSLVQALASGWTN